MRFTVYRSLGRESSFLGIAESYLPWFIIAALVSLVPSLLVGRLVYPIVGFVIYGGLFFGAYFGVLWVQSRWRRRDLTRLMAGWRHPRRILCRPMRLDAYLSRWTPAHGLVQEKGINKD